MRLDALKLNHLRYYVAAIETGSFVAAGERLHIAKTSIAHGVSCLETLLGTQLLLRKRSGGVTTTPEGEKFLAACRNFLFEAEMLIDEFQSNTDSIRGQLTVGCQESVSWAIAPRVIKELKHLHPELSVNLQTIPLEELLAPIREGQVDLLINFKYGRVPAVLNSKDYYIQVFCEPKVYAMMSSEHPLCKRKRKKLYLKDLEPYPHNLLEGGSVMNYLGYIYDKAGFQPNIETTNSSSLGAQSAVGDSKTVALRFFRPSINFSPIGDPLAFLEIADEVDRPKIVAVARKNADGKVSMRAKAFIDVCQRKFEDGTFKENLFYD